jgi:hypothetical protein
MADKPTPKNSEGAKELEKVQKQFDAFDSQVKELTHDRMSVAPKEDIEPQTKIAQVDKNKMKDVYLKPFRSFGAKEKFNEKFRESYNFDKEYVHFTAEHKELIGETIEMWVKPYPGVPCEEWKVPTNKPVWAPRYVAERIKGCKYHRLFMEQSTSTGNDYAAQYYGTLAVDRTIQRLDAYPESTRKSVFMGALKF